MKKLPVRLCVGCQEPHNKREMIRIVKSPEGEFSVDFTGKKSGRGAYICKNIECLNTAVKQRRLEKSFKCQIDNSVYEQLKEDFAKLDEQ